MKPALLPSFFVISCAVSSAVLAQDFGSTSACRPSDPNCGEMQPPPIYDPPCAGPAEYCNGNAVIRDPGVEGQVFELRQQADMIYGRLQQLSDTRARSEGEYQMLRSEYDSLVIQYNDIWAQINYYRAQGR